jgi:hypothetical protein
MRNYWLRIILGALGIFVVGMVVITVVRSVKRKADSTDPLTIPVGFVPFRLDGERLGTIRAIRLLRSAPHALSGVELRVRLADSVPGERVGACGLLVADDLDNIDENTTLRCSSTAADTAGLDLVAFGTVSFGGRPEALTLLIPRKDAAEMSNDGGGRLHMRVEGGSARADSIEAVTEAHADSIEAAAEQLADSITAAVEQRREVSRAAVDAQLDSVMARAESIRAVARARAESLRSAHQRSRR